MNWPVLDFKIEISEKKKLKRQQKKFKQQANLVDILKKDRTILSNQACSQWANLTYFKSSRKLDPKMSNFAHCAKQKNSNLKIQDAFWPKFGQSKIIIFLIL